MEYEFLTYSVTETTLSVATGFSLFLTTFRSQPVQGGLVTAHCPDRTTVGVQFPVMHMTCKGLCHGVFRHPHLSSLVMGLALSIVEV